MEGPLGASIGLLGEALRKGAPPFGQKRVNGVFRFSGMVRYVLEHAGKFYENCKKNQEKKDSILNAIEKM